MNNIINKGTGAGGANTNNSGLPFEKLLSNEPYLLANGFLKVNFGKTNNMYYLQKQYIQQDIPKIVYYAKKKAFKYLAKNIFNVDICKEPDEAYLIHSISDNTYQLKIIEIKNQNTDGSVEDKLMTCNMVRRMYNEFFNKFNIQVDYAFSISNFLKKKFISDTLKYVILRKLFIEDNITVFYGEDNDYSQQLNTWLHI